MPEIGLKMSYPGTDMPEIGLKMSYPGTDIPEIGLKMPYPGTDMPEIGLKIPEIELGMLHPGMIQKGCLTIAYTVFLPCRCYFILLSIQIHHMHIHFIAIGGSAMHNLAIALHKKGYHVTGSDDEIFEPSLGRLRRYGLLPSVRGWNPDLIVPGLDAVVLGMHARADNPELIRARKLGIKIYSYPEYLYEQSKNKKRVVIGGSHGKTTITSMILHVLNRCGLACDYMVGAQLEGFEVMVRLSDDAPCMVLEGDEYLTSALDRRPKFHVYMPDIALISGIAWDHINVFPTFENYAEQFRLFANLLPAGGALIYCEVDPTVYKLARSLEKNIRKIPYGVPPHIIEEGNTFLLNGQTRIPLLVIGEHNLMNVDGARLVCRELGVEDRDFYTYISSFKGASKRLELIGQNDRTIIFKDFAHAPSKLLATTGAVKRQYPGRALVACLELHTFSSLNRDFLGQYKGSMDQADVPIVYYNPKVVEHKKLPPISPADVRSAFGHPGLAVYTDSAVLLQDLISMDWKDKALLLMSSGNFDGIDFNDLAGRITGLTR
jgi:UDP-N-acetylmuramate: L-alanyl-gamma-D-glutamyl-meso-diaminopimelate ligase